MIAEIGKHHPNWHYTPTTTQPNTLRCVHEDENTSQRRPIKKNTKVVGHGDRKVLCSDPEPRLVFDFPKYRKICGLRALKNSSVSFLSNFPAY
jgi:hypothetical protein